MKPPSWIRVEYGWFYPIKEGPSSKTTSSQLGSCRGQHSFTLACQSLLWNWRFWICVASPILSWRMKLALLTLWLKDGGGGSTSCGISVSSTDATFLALRELNKMLIFFIEMVAKNMGLSSHHTVGSSKMVGGKHNPSLWEPIRMHHWVLNV